MKNKVDKLREPRINKKKLKKKVDKPGWIISIIILFE